MSFNKGKFNEKPTINSNSTQMEPPHGQYQPPPYSGTYPGAPPPYSAQPPDSAAFSNHSSYYPYGAGVQPQAQPYAHYGQPNPNPCYPVQQNFNYGAPPTAVAQFDSGARFDGIATHRIPPPPPGCAPNAAQLAAAQGGSVVATQKKAGWFSGTGGGITFW